jgi:hypothetical protein
MTFGSSFGRTFSPTFQPNSLAVGVGGFIPTDISGCLMWVDFSDKDSMFTDNGTTKVSSDTDLIYRINDKSGNSNYWSQSTDTLRPMYKTSIKNSLSVGRFNEDNMLFASRLTTIRTAYFVFSCGETDSKNRFLLGDTTYGWHRGYNTDAVTGRQAYFSGDDPYNYANAYVRESTVYRNNTSVSPTANSPLSTIHLSVVITTGNMPANKFQGDRGGTTRYWIGDVAEVILYSTAHSDTERGQVTDYLNSKWALY